MADEDEARTAGCRRRGACLVQQRSLFRCAGKVGVTVASCFFPRLGDASSRCDVMEAAQWSVVTTFAACLGRLSSTIA